MALRPWLPERTVLAVYAKHTSDDRLLREALAALEFVRTS